MMSDDIKRPLNLRAMRSTRCRKHSSVIVVHIGVLSSWKQPSKNRYMDMVSNYTQAGCGVKQCSAVAKFPNVW